MSIRKREFLTGLGLTAAGMTGALAQSYPKGKDLGAVAPAPKKDIPHRKVTTHNLFKVPDGYPNGVAVVPEGVWVAEQKAAGSGLWQWPCLDGRQWRTRRRVRGGHERAHRQPSPDPAGPGR